MKALFTALLVFAIAQPALAQWDLLKKGATMARAMTRDFTEEEEVAIGRIVAARVLATYPLSEDKAMQRYVSLVGETVAAYSDRPDLDWHFAILDTPVVNAFSCPGGYIFITEGALAQISSEAELAVILGHEIAHATEKHILKEVKRANVVGEGMNIAQSELGGGGMSDALARKVSDLAYQKLFNTGIGRKEELASDRIGVELAAAAGYRSAAYVNFLEGLQALATAKSSSFEQLGSTHPGPDDRLNSIRPRLSDSGQLLADRWEKRSR